MVHLTSLPTKPAKATSRREMTKFLKDQKQRKEKKKRQGQFIYFNNEELVTHRVIFEQNTSFLTRS